MPDSPQDVYVRHLLSERGYPLWRPEPSRRLPLDYLREGLRIGDVGVVVPENGSFDVFFNICLPEDHALHRRGVPDNFVPVVLNDEDIDKFPDAECLGRVIASPSVKQVDPSTDISHARTEFNFFLPPAEGALLVLPHGSEQHDLRIRRKFMDEALQHAIDWYDFAERRLHRIISHDALYLITGFYKARSWALSSFPCVEGICDFPVRFTTAHSYTWRHERALDPRTGPPDEFSNGCPNQSIFISGFKISVKDELLVWKRITVKAENAPEHREASTVVGRASWVPNLWSNLSRMGGDAVAGGSGALSLSSGSRSRVTGATNNHVNISHVPHVPKMLHPSDIINQWLLNKEPSAKIAITHDSEWTTMLKVGEIMPQDLPRQEALESVLSIGNKVILQDGAVFLVPKTVGRSPTPFTRSTSVSMPFQSLLVPSPPSLSGASPHLVSALHYPVVTMPTYEQIKPEEDLPVPPSLTPSTQTQLTTSPYSSYNQDWSEQDVLEVLELIQVANGLRYHSCQWLTDNGVCGELVQCRRLSEHLSTHHSIPGPDKTTVTCYWNRCGVSFHKGVLMRHVIEAHLGIRFPCPVCDACFIRSGVLKMHMRDRHSMVV